MEQLVIELRALWGTTLTSTWRSSVKGTCLRHPLRAVVHQDPFTKWSFDKPCGYPGDASLLDFIYEENDALQRVERATTLGQQLFAWGRHTATCRAIRYRRDQLAAKIDQICQKVCRPHVLSVGCGHVRELRLTQALHDGKLGRFVALDQDSETLVAVEKEYGNYGVETKCASIQNLLKKKATYGGSFDLIYVSGLYDYLSDLAASRLTENLFRILRPDGRLIITNLSPSLPGIGYMESYMAWELTYRDREALKRVGARILEDGAALNVHEENFVVSLEIRRLAS